MPNPGAIFLNPYLAKYREAAARDNIGAGVAGCAHHFFSHRVEYAGISQEAADGARRGAWNVLSLIGFHTIRRTPEFCVRGRGHPSVAASTFASPVAKPSRALSLTAIDSISYRSESPRTRKFLSFH
jgi:hypothetical protein